MYLLDTNIISYWMRGDPVTIAWIKARSPSDLSLCAVTLAEIWYGIEKSPVKKKERRAKIEKIASVLKVYPFDETAAASYAIVRTQLERKGMGISERDTQIAAIAMANRLTVVTRNVREFRRIEKLRVEDGGEKF
ncbi:MAG: type II toxin-antitoxin system VapC family toxin [Deltaproteobacteria bacterium]|nr:type II toxin-antitoxin system VapC family toxin [Deltaproteobacteria bacterium]